MFKDKSNTKFLLFYIVIFYVFAFLFWWSYLLYSKTGQHFSDVSNYKSLQYEVYTGNNQIDFFSTEEFKELDKNFTRQKFMIITEGMVFFAILLLGMFKVHKSFKQEINMARQQKNFLLSITHELKSPLSSIKLMNQTIKKRDLPKNKQVELLDSSLSEVERLENLVENILITAKIDNNQFGFNKEKIDISIICNQMSKNYQNRKDIEFSSNIESNIEIIGDKICLNSIISNLIDNAVKYAHQQKVSLNLIKENNKAVLEISDTGNGIPDNEKPKVFDKFYRIGNEETRAAKGTGLGLYIVKQLVYYHNAKIFVLNNSPKGTVFKIVFPL